MDHHPSGGRRLFKNPIHIVKGIRGAWATITKMVTVELKTSVSRQELVEFMHGTSISFSLMRSLRRMWPGLFTSERAVQKTKAEDKTDAMDALGKPTTFFVAPLKLAVGDEDDNGDAAEAAVGSVGTSKKKRKAKKPAAKKQKVAIGPSEKKAKKVPDLNAPAKEWSRQGACLDVLNVAKLLFMGVCHNAAQEIQVVDIEKSVVETKERCKQRKGRWEAKKMEAAAECDSEKCAAADRELLKINNEAKNLDIKVEKAGSMGGYKGYHVTAVKRRTYGKVIHEQVKECALIVSCIWKAGLDGRNAFRMDTSNAQGNLTPCTPCTPCTPYTPCLTLPNPA